MNQNTTRPRTKKYRRYYSRLLWAVFADALAVIAAYGIVFSARAANADLIASESITPILFNVVIMVSMLYLFGVYQRIWDQTSGHEVRIIIYAVAADTMIFTLFNVSAQPRPLPLSVVLLGNLLTLCAFVAIRYRSRLISGIEWRWHAFMRLLMRKPDHAASLNKRRVLIVGAGESGQALVWRLKHRFANNDYHVVGFIDDDPNKQDMYIEGCRVLGTRHDIVRLVEAYAVDLIVLAVHNISGADFRSIVGYCEQTKALIKVVPDVFAAVHNQNYAALLRDVQIEDLIGRSVIARHENVDLRSITQRVILVTGAAGSIGAELSRQVMLYDPKRVILLDNNESGLHDLVTELRTRFPQIEMIPALVDVSIVQTLRAIFTRFRPQVIFHAAAYKHVPMMEYYPTEALRVNITGTRNVIELAAEFDAERFVLISTDKAVNPSSIMGATKRLCELMIHHMSQRSDNRTVFTAVRFGNVLGSRGSVVPTFTRQIDSGGPVTVTHRDMMRYFMSIPEAVNLIIHAACITTGDDIFILRMGEEVRIVDLAERMIRIRGLRPYIDIEINFTGIRPGEKMHEELYNASEAPDETIHPNIIRLGRWEHDYTSAVFWGLVDQLVSDPPHEAASILARLHHIMQIEFAYNISAD